MRGNLQGLLGQVQKMQKNMERVQKELAALEITGEAGAGLVKVTVTCNHQAHRVEIDPSLFTGNAIEDKEMLEDLVAAAINDVAHKIEETSAAKMRAATAGIPLPPGMKLSL